MILGVVVLVVYACSKKTVPSGTPNSAAPAKAQPTENVPKVSYVSNIRPLIEAKCTPCHIPSRGGFKTAFDNYNAAKSYIRDMITRVQLSSSDPKYMPFKKPPLSKSDIDLLINWQKGGLVE